MFLPLEHRMNASETSDGFRGIFYEYIQFLCKIIGAATSYI